MILQPAVIALLLAAGLAAVVLLAAAPFAWQMVRRWDLDSGSETQLELERRTYLFSALLAFVFALQLAALLLFVFTADRLADRFVGAMCAVGTLQVNDWGVPALLAQLVVFFAAAVWLVINHVDNQARDYPLVRVKYALLLGLAPLLLASLGLQLAFFSGLRADVITSCCGSLFADDARTVAGEVAAMAPRSAMFWLVAALALAVGSALWHQKRRGALSGAVLALSSAHGFAAGLAGVVSFVSLYVYEHPGHHCPLCILKPEYHHQGYALYLPLFTGTAAGLSAGALQAFRARPGLVHLVPAASARLARVAGLGFTLFAVVAAAMVASSRLVLLG